jgi:hypothetical protein
MNIKLNEKSLINGDEKAIFRTGSDTLVSGRVTISSSPINAKYQLYLCPASVKIPKDHIIGSKLETSDGETLDITLTAKLLNAKAT